MIVALVPLDKPAELLGYMNVFAEGDIWQKIRGCEDCPPENNCCKNCPVYVEGIGCKLHILNNGQDKPSHCVVHPSPLKHRPNCCLEYKCVKGKFEGLIRRQCEQGNVLINEKTGEKIIVS